MRSNLMQLLVRKFATSRVFVLSGWIFAFLFSFIWRHSHGNVKVLLETASDSVFVPEFCHNEVTDKNDKQKSVLIITPFSSNETHSLEEYGEPYMSVMREKYKKHSQAMDVNIVPLFVIDGQMFVEKLKDTWPNTDNLLSLYARFSMYGPDHIYDFSPISNYASNLSFDSLKYITAEHYKHDAIILLQNANEQLSVDIIAKCLEIMPNFDVGCLNKQCTGSFAISSRLVPPIVELNMAPEDVFSSRSAQYLNKFRQYRRLLTRSHKNVKVIVDKLEVLEPRILFSITYGAKLWKNVTTTNITEFGIKRGVPAQYQLDIQQNETEFKYIPDDILDNKCQRVNSQFAYLIKTGRNAAMERFRIRRYFRDRHGKDEKPIKNYYFMLGTDHNGEAFINESALDYERQLYDDIIVADFEDTYNNLPTKTRSMYHFAVKYCSEDIKYYYFQDSDTILNSEIEKLVMHSFHPTESEKTRQICKDKDTGTYRGCFHDKISETDPMMLCLRYSGQNHSALYWGKYNVTHDMFPPSYFFPDYCNGQCALINRHAVLAIDKETRRTAMGDFRIEDIYFTGILREKAKITKIQEFVKTIFAMKGKSGKERSILGQTCNHDSKETKLQPKPFIKSEKWLVADTAYDYKLMALFKEKQRILAEQKRNLAMASHRISNVNVRKNSKDSIYARNHLKKPLPQKPKVKK